MTTGARWALGTAVAAALGAVGATIWIGAAVKEETVVARPYEEGLRYDAERHARSALGWDVRIAAPPAGPGRSELAFDAVDGAGRPLEGAAASVLVARPDTSRGARAFDARAAGGGRYLASLELPAAGPWTLRFDLRRGPDRVQVERAVEVPAPCDAGAGPCTRPLAGGGEATLALGTRPPRTMRELAVSVEVREGGAPVDGAAVSVAFSMPGMEMGEHAAALAGAGGGRYAGKVILVRCASGRRDWLADVTVARPGAAPRTARFGLTVAE